MDIVNDQSNMKCSQQKFCRENIPHHFPAQPSSEISLSFETNINQTQLTHAMMCITAISKFLGCVNLCFISHLSGVLCQPQQMWRNTRLMTLQT